MWIDAQNTCTEIGSDGDSCRLCQNEMDQFCRVVKIMFFLMDVGLELVFICMWLWIETEQKWPDPCELQELNDLP